MKKLMMAAAIVCAAACAQAATVNWTIAYDGEHKILPAVGGTKAWTSGTSGNTDQIAYLVLSADVDALVTGIKAGEVTASMYLDSTTTFAPAQGVTTDYKATPSSDKITTAEQAFKTVLVYKDSAGDTWYQVSGEAKSTERASGDIPTNVAFDSGKNFATGNWQMVPEPTSGLLLLLGVAGLALRRRRA